MLAVAAAALLAAGGTPPPALGHSFHQFAPNGRSPFHTAQSFFLTAWYDDGYHVDWWGDTHVNDQYGIDLAPTGEPCFKYVYPIWDGLRADYVEWGEGGLEMHGWVNGEWRELLYWHLDRVYVRPGQVLRSDTPVGTTGTRGNSTGCHLHMSVHVLRSDFWYSERPVICGGEIPRRYDLIWASCSVSGSGAPPSPPPPPPPPPPSPPEPPPPVAPPSTTYPAAPRARRLRTCQRRARARRTKRQRRAALRRCRARWGPKRAPR